MAFVVGCANSPLTQTSIQSNVVSGKGILWKIEKQGLPVSYVFGTMHSEDKRVTNLPEEVNAAFSSATTFAMEMILDDKNTKDIVAGMYFKSGKTLKSVTSKKVYLQSVEAMAQKGMPEKIVNIMKPWAVFTVLSMPEQKTGLFLDALLYESALKNNKKVVGLETMQEQLAVFNEMKLSTQISLLETTLDSADDLNEILDETIDIYLTHDLDKILLLNSRYMALLDDAVAKDFNQRLLIDRNVRMVKRILPLLEKGNVFVAIGALHLPGKVGVLTILKNAGYTVSSVY